MKKALVFILFGMMIFVHAWLVSADEKASQKVVDLAQSELVNVGAITFGVDVDKIE